MTLKILPIQEICVLRGQALDIEVPVKNDDGTDANLSGATLEFGLSVDSNKPYVLEKTPSAVSNILTASIVEADYDTLIKKQYYYSFWVIIEGSPTPVARGFLNIANDSRSIT